MNSSDRHIDNPLFFKWIYQPTPELDDYWQKYIKLYPDEEKEILSLRKQFLKLKISKDVLSQLEKEAFARQILVGLENQDKKKAVYRLLFRYVKYAAIALLFLLIGGGGIFLQYSQKYNALLIQNLETPVNTTEPVLILDENYQVRLEDKTPSVDYSRNNLVVLGEKELINTLKYPENQLIVPYGSQVKIKLADGTLVWLNSGSRLLYPASFNGKSREVSLVGEAFFDVQSDSERPFIVNTSEVKIKVLGTRFNISAYPEERYVQTTLEEGAISLKKRNAGWFDRDLALKPNQQAVINKTTGDLTINSVEALSYGVWVQGMLSFQNAELRTVISRLERFYNIRIRYGQAVNREVEISGKLDLNKQRKEVFEYLERAAGISFVPIDEYSYQLE